MRSPLAFGAASVVIVSPDRTSVLVRKNGKYYQLIGGRINAGETPIEAAVRETKEESGIELDPTLLHPVHDGKYEKCGQWLTHYFFSCVLSEQPMIATTEKMPLWLSIGEAQQRKSYPGAMWDYARAVRSFLGRPELEPA